MGAANQDARVPEVPSGWSLVRTRGSLGFVTHAYLLAPNGSEYEWTSRRHRKRLGLLESGSHRPKSWVAHASSMSWWLAALFGIGAVCFGVGSFPLFFNSVSASFVAWTFFIGSLFFTTAGYLQFHEAATAPQAILPTTHHRLRLRTVVRWRPHRIDWWSALIQFAGTIAFSVSTLAATRSALTTAQERHLIWTPDAFGSVCFLVSCWLAYTEVNRGVLPRSDHSVGWRIVALNLVGAVAFGVAAIAARYLPTTDEPANVVLVNLGTFVGAVCFVVGAAMLPVESARDAAQRQDRSFET